MFAAASKSGRAGSAAPTTDPYFLYVPLLLESTSTNGQQNNTFLDSGTANGGVGFTITRNGTPTQGSRTPYWPDGQWSNYFSSSYLSVADSASLRFGAGNFTIEAWVFRTASGATHTIACKGSSTGPTGWVFQISSADKLVFIDTSTSITGTTSLAANTWYYVAVVRTGTGASQTILYVNGASDGTGTSATTFSQTDAMRIGTDRSAANGFAGYVSNLRLSNTNLTISSTPTTPLTALGSTIFLSCGYNRFVDGSSLASAITVGSGTPSVQAFQPFSPAASYSAATYAGSGYFNGSTDYLTVPSNSAFELGANNFTIETWVQTTSSVQYTSIAAKQTSSATGNWWFLINNASATAGDVAFWCYDYNTFLTAMVVTTGANVRDGAWHHIALVRNGTSWVIYIDGISRGTQTALTTIGTLSAAVYIGNNQQNNTKYFPGYISNFRIVNGTAVYTTAFTPPTTPVTNITNTSLLLNMANAGIYDAAAQNDITTSGTAQTSTTQYKWSPTSMKFSGAASDWLTMPAAGAVPLGSGNWTIEGWFYFSSVTGNLEIFSKETTANDGIRCVLVSSKINLSLSSNGTIYATTVVGATTITTGTWYYLAFTRSANAITIYLNGVSDGTGTFSGTLYETNTFWGLATRGGAGTPFNGYIQDFRITAGVARTITTPTAAFPTR